MAKRWRNIIKANSTSFSSAVGSESKFTSLISDFTKKNIDISFSREFTTINEDMVSYYSNSAKHLNTKYLQVDKTDILPKNAPVTELVMRFLRRQHSDG